MMNLEMIEDLPIQVSQNQERIWLSDKLTESPHRHHWTVLNITGSLNIRSLQCAYNDVINKHQILKSAFDNRENELSQRVFQCEEWNFDVLDFNKASYSEIRHFMIREARRSFKLHRQPAIRAMLIKGDTDHYYFSVGIHPIAADKGSIQVFWNDLIQRYQVIEEDENFRTPDPGLQFSEVISEVKAPFTISEKGQASDAWELSDFEPAPVMVDQNRTVEQKAIYSILNFPISDELRQSIEIHCAQLGIDNQLYFLTAFKTLLSQTTGKDNLVVGCPFDSRQEHHKSVIGPFENILPVTSRIDPTRSFSELVKEVRNTVDQAINRGNTPAHHIDIQCKFGYEEHPTADFIAFANTQFEWEMSPMDCSPFDLTLTVKKESGDLKAYVVFRADLFNKATITGLLQGFEEVLKFVVSAPDRPVSELALGDDHEAEQGHMDVSEIASFQNELDLILA